MKIVIPDKIDFTLEQQSWLEEQGATVFEDVPSNSTEVAERIKDAEIITANYIDITPELIDCGSDIVHYPEPGIIYGIKA